MSMSFSSEKKNIFFSSENRFLFIVKEMLTEGGTGSVFLIYSTSKIIPANKFLIP